MKQLGRGKRKRIYPVEDYQTPYEKLVGLADFQQFLKPGITPAVLQQKASRMSDTEAAERMQRIKCELLEKYRG